MLVYPTNTTGVYPNEFQIDRLYSRLAGNTTWSRKLQESGELDSGRVYGGTSFTSLNTRNYCYHTLPTTEKFYIITALEWKNNVISGGASVISGVDLVNAIPPTLNSTPLVALCQARVQSGPGLTQKVTTVFSNPIRGGTILGAWLNISLGTNASVYRTVVSSREQRKAITYNETPDYSDNTAFTNDTEEVDIKIYYRGYV